MHHGGTSSERLLVPIWSKLFAGCSGVNAVVGCVAGDSPGSCDGSCDHSCHRSCDSTCVGRCGFETDPSSSLRLAASLAKLASGADVGDDPLPVSDLPSNAPTESATGRWPDRLSWTSHWSVSGTGKSVALGKIGMWASLAGSLGVAAAAAA